MSKNFNYVDNIYYNYYYRDWRKLRHYLFRTYFRAGWSLRIAFL